MRNLLGRACAGAFSLILSFFGLAHAQVNVTTFHNDNSRTGQNTQETILTTSNVNSAQFGKLFSVAVDGYVFAQPLYLSAVHIASGTHNVVYVATENDSVYAIDADTGTIYLQVSLIPSGGRAVNSATDLGCGDLVPTVGITGTPVIDPQSGTLYVVAKSYVNGSVVQYLHALDVTTLTEKFNGPTEINAAVPGTGTDSSGGVVTFSPLLQNQRPALLLENGHVIISWSSHCDGGGYLSYHGWVMSYSAASLQQEAVFNDSPNTDYSGIWMSGGGPAADTSGNIYVPTGNGVWNGTTDWGDTILKLAPPAGGTFAVTDYFTPFDQLYLGDNDVDVSSGGLLLLPPLSGTGTQMLAQQGKAGTIYVLNTGNLGKYCGNLTPPCTNSDTQPQVQEILNASSGIWGSPAYWNGNLYWAGANDAIRAYSFNTTSGVISTSFTSQSAQVFAFAAPTPAISSNGNTNGILWALDGSADDSTCDGGSTNCLGLYAYDATNLANLLYNSAQAANNRDSPGATVKFATPVIANGKVYLGTQGTLSVYGLLGGSPAPAATPGFSPAAGTYTGTQSVTISDTTPGAVIYYTTNGTTPTTASTPYGGAISVSASETLKAIATASGYSTSAVGTAAYTINALSPAATPGFSPAAGTYTGTQSVTISDTTPGAVIYYTTNGTTPTTASTPYGGAISVSASETLKAIATASGYSTSAVGSAAYTINATPTVATPSFSPAAGSYSGTQSVTISDTTPGAAIYYTTNGTTPTTASTPYGGAISVSASETLEAIATASGYSPSAVGSAAYTIGGSAAPVINDPSGFGSTAGFSFVSGASLAGSALEITDGGQVEGRAVWYATPVNVQSFTTDFNFQITPTGANVADGFTFTLQNAAGGVNAIGASGGGLGYQGLGSSVAVKFDLFNNAGEGSDSTGFYINGASPTEPAVDMTASGVNVHSGDILHAHLTYDGTTLTLTLTDTVTGASFITSTVINIPATVGANTAYAGFTGGTGGYTATQQILNWTYSAVAGTPTAATPGFSPAAGTYTGTQSVTISDTTPGAVIYYTTNGTTPTTASTPYGGAISVSASETLKAIATASGYSTSAVGSAAYTINALSPAATPGFSPAAGTYTGTQSVTISDTTPGAVIYYTTNGTTPTTASTPYGGAISVSASETLKAIATASGYSTSAVGTAAYTINALSPAATPGFSPAAGTYTGTQSVTISDTTPGAVIYYTTNGTTPTTASTPYGGAISVSASETLKAIATASGYSTSAVGSAAYTINATPTVATPSFSPAAGSYSGTQSVTISDTTPGAAIYYTTNGTTPTTASTPYGGAISVSASETLEAIATASGYSPSAVGSAAYTIGGSAAPVINDPSGFASTAGFSFVSGAALAGSALEITDGGQVEGRAVWYATPVNVQSFTTDFNFQITPTGANVADGFTFTLQNAAGGVNAIGASGGGLGYQGLGSSVAVKFDLFNNAGEGSDSTGFYINGASPTEPAVDMTASGVNVHSGDILHAHLTYDGTTLTLTLTDTVTGASFITSTVINIPATVGANTAYAGFTGGTGGYTATQQILNWTYSAVAGTPTAATPGFSPAAGTYTGTQSVTISDTTPGAVIYYTTNGTTPTTASTPYGGAISVSASETLKAIATASGYSTSAVGTAAYTINALSPAATPGFSPAAGTYTGTQSVTISDTTPGAVIYYTTNGTTPTTASTPYGGAISVSASETLKAIATASGYSTSAVGSAAYTINATPTVATPSFSPAAGSYSGTQSVTISDTTPGAAIYYTTNGTTPTTASTPYGGAISVSASETLEAIATASGYSPSAVGSAAYTIGGSAAPVINDPSGFASTAGFSFVSGAALAGSALEITDGGQVEGRAVWYATPVNVQSFTTDFNFQITPTGANVADGFTFTLQNAAGGVNAIGASGGGLGYQGLGSSVAVKFDLFNNAGEGSDSTGFYINGASPTEPAVDMTASGVNVHSGDILHAHLTYDGTTLTLTLTDTVTGASFITSTVINIPATVGANTAYAGFTGGTGGYTATQQILNWTYSH